MKLMVGRVLALAGILAIAGLLAGLLLGWSIARRGISARNEPSRLEEFLALRMRALATPARVRAMKNPLNVDAALLTGARHHFADHCASCHANDGGGATELGKNLYPKAPDLRGARSQQLTDGELYGIIQNGIRLSGMPAWGDAHENDEESWALVAFIRHLPQVSADELREMESLNPKGPGDRAEEQDEESFLDGSDGAAPDGGPPVGAGGAMKGMKGMRHAP